MLCRNDPWGKPCKRDADGSDGLCRYCRAGQTNSIHARQWKERQEPATASGEAAAEGQGS